LFLPVAASEKGKHGFAETAEAACSQRAQVWKRKGLA